jgi:hypothetical protein
LDGRLYPEKEGQIAETLTRLVKELTADKLGNCTLPELR